MRLYTLTAHDEDGNVIREWKDIARWQVSETMFKVLTELEEDQFFTVTFSIERKEHQP